MPYEYVILSPEKVELRYDIGGIGSRALAAVLDDFLLFLMHALILTAVALLEDAFGFTSNLAASIGWGWLIGGYIFFVFLSWFGYYIFFEIIWNGQTIGKRLLGLRVIKMDGTPAAPVNIFMRELVRLVDALPLCLFGYTVAGSVAFFNPYSQRIGDMLAGTIVVKERRTSLPEVERLSEMSEQTHPLEGLVPSVQSLSTTDYRAIRNFLDRRDQFPPEVRQHLSNSLFAQVTEKLSLMLPPDTPVEQLLEAVVRKVARERGLLD